MKLLRFIDKTIEGAAVLAFAASSFLILLNVVNRYVIFGLMRNLSKNYEGFKPVYLFFREHLGSLSVMADEVPGLLLVWISFLGAYLVLRSNGHIGFDMLVEALPKRGRRFLSLLNTVLFGGLLVVLLVQSTRMIRLSGQTEIETAEIAQGWFMLILPVAAVLFLGTLAERAYAEFNTNREQD